MASALQAAYDARLAEGEIRADPAQGPGLAALLRPGGGIDTVLTADAYGQGEAEVVTKKNLAEFTK